MKNKDALNQMYKREQELIRRIELLTSTLLRTDLSFSEKLKKSTQLQQGVRVQLRSLYRGFLLISESQNIDLHKLEIDVDALGD